MTERRKQERRKWRSKPFSALVDREGNLVTNRRRIVDRRVSSLEQDSLPQPKHRLLIHFHDQLREMSRGRATTLMLGRNGDCDIEVPASVVSRHHARVEHGDTGFALVDQSTNGTYIRFDDGRQTHLLKDRISLEGSGIISLGRPIHEREPNLIYFWCNPASPTES